MTRSHTRWDLLLLFGLLLLLCASTSGGSRDRQPSGLVPAGGALESNYLTSLEAARRGGGGGGGTGGAGGSGDASVIPFHAGPSEDVFIMGSLSGNVFGVDKMTGETLWTIDTGGPILTSSQTPIIPALDGSIYLFTMDGLQKNPASIYDIVRESPFSLEDSIIYLGSKKTSLFVVDGETGEVFKCFSDSNEILGDCTLPDDPLVFGRVDFTVTAIDTSTHTERWNMTMGKYVSGIDTSPYKIPTTLSPSSSNVTLLSSVDGSLSLIHLDTGNRLWTQQFESPIVHCHESQHDEDFLLYFNEQLLIRQNEVFVGAHGDTMFVLPPTATLSAPSVPFLGVNEGALVALSERVKEREEKYESWIESLREEYERQSVLPGGIPALSYVSDCSPDSLFYPACLIGVHADIYHHDYLHSEISDSNSGPGYTVTPLQSPPGDGLPLSLPSPPVGISLSLWLLPLFLVLAGVSLYAAHSFYSYLRTPPAPTRRRKKKRRGGKKGHSNELSPALSAGKSAPEGGGGTSVGGSGSGGVGGEGGAQEEEDPNVTLLGSLRVDTSSILGYGSSGTIVYKGQYQDREVAIKRILIDFYEAAQKEIDLLIESDEHPSVLRYYAKEQDVQFVYLALALCPQSLSDFVDSKKYSKKKPSELKSLLSQIASGVQYLHSLHIVHRDIKPQNILIDVNGKAKISDMGLAKKLDFNKSSFSTQATGTVGWQAPELLSEDSLVRVTKKVDIFSYGCVFHYVLTGGQHPFGGHYERQIRAMRNDSNLSAQLIRRFPLAADLTRKTVCADPSARLSSSQLLHHPYYWNSTKILQFLLDSSDKLEFDDPFDNLIQRFEIAAPRIIGVDFTRKLHKDLLEDLNRYRKYDVRKMRDLIRVIRNKAHHFRDLSPNLQKILGPMPGGYVRYFSHLFPLFIPYLYNFMRENCNEDEKLKVYFGEDIELEDE